MKFVYKKFFRILKSIAPILAMSPILFNLVRPLGVFAAVPACAYETDPTAAARCEEIIFQRYGVSFLDTERQDCTNLSTAATPADKSLYLVGDSIGVGLEAPLKSSLSGWTVDSDSKSGRPLSEGIPIAEQYMKENKPGAALVVLGTNNLNSGDNEQQIKNMVSAINGQSATTEIFWLEINVTRSDLVDGAKSFNELLAANGSVNVLSSSGELADGVHPKDYNTLAQSIAQSINGTENSTPSPNCTCGAVAVSGGSNNEETVFKFFVANSYTKEQSAGIVGNMIAESGVNPKIVQGGGESDTPPSSGGYGIVQWTPGSKILADAQEKGQSPSDLNFQMNLLLDQLAGKSKIPEAAAGEDLRKQTTVDGAAKSFMLKYERPADKSSGRQNERARLAEGVFQRYASTTSGASTTAGSSCETASENIIDGFVVYSQTDPRWKDKPYSTSTIGVSGCGPSAVAMIVATWVDKSVTPETVASQFGDYYVDGQGSRHDLIPAAVAKWGLSAEGIGKNMSAAQDALRNGKVVVAVGRGADPFTQGGHFIVLRGITEEGKILVGDSGHDDTSDKEWDPSIISSGLSADGDEMWVISQ